MKKILLLISIGSLIVLSLWQVSCTTGQYRATSPPEMIPSSTSVQMEGPDEGPLSDVKQSGEAISTELEDTADKRMLLAGQHIDAGIECSECHIEESDDNKVSTAVCITCHEDIAEIATAGYAGGINPHNSHMMFSECSDCHHAHFPSQDQCQGCHAFGFQIP